MNTDLQEMNTDLLEILQWLIKHHGITQFYGSVIRDGKEIVSLTYKNW